MIGCGLFLLVIIEAIEGGISGGSYGLVYFRAVPVGVWDHMDHSGIDSGPFAFEPFWIRTILDHGPFWTNILDYHPGHLVFLNP